MSNATLSYAVLQEQLLREREAKRLEARARLCAQIDAQRAEVPEEAPESVVSLAGRVFVLLAFLSLTWLCSCQPMRAWVAMGDRTPEWEANAAADLVTLQRLDVKRRLNR